MQTMATKRESILQQQNMPSVLSKDKRFSKDAVIPPIQRADGASDTMSETQAIPVVDDFSYSSKLTNVEAQRIMAVLQEIQKKVHLVGMIQDTMDKRMPSALSGESYSLVKVFNK